MSFLQELFGRPNIDKLKAKRDIRRLIKALQYEEDWHIRLAAAEALGELKDPLAIEPLAIHFDHEVVQQGVVKALVTIGESAVAPLCAALKHSNELVRQNAALALGQFGGARAVEPLCAALNDTDARVRLWAAQALERLADSRAVVPLCAALRDTDVGVRQRAAAALTHFADERAVEPLCAALKHSGDGIARRRAADALIKCSSSLAVEPLCAYLADSEKEVRLLAAEVLVNLYRSHKLDEKHTRLILAQQQKLTEKHTDGTVAITHDDYQHRDSGPPNYGDCAHKDSTTWGHQDLGIGVGFET